MRKVINYLTIFYGLIFILSGFLKYFDLLETFKISLGGKYFVVNVSDSLFYIIAVNIIGGGAFVFHAIRTLGFAKISKTGTSTIDIDVSEKSIVNPLSTAVSLAGYITLLISFFLLIQTFILLGSFEGVMMDYLPLFFGTIAFFLPQSIIPGYLALRNTMLNNDIENKTRRKRTR